MPKPKTKKELLDLSQNNFKKLLELVDGYSEEEVGKEFRAGTLNRNIRDVLAHLHAWHLMMYRWYEVGMTGEKPMMPAEGYTWKTLPELNKKLWQDSQNIALETVKVLLNESYKKVQVIIKNHTDNELFEKKRYKWTGSTSLGQYFISNTSSHYDWAIRLIKKSMK